MFNFILFCILKQSAFYSGSLRLSFLFCIIRIDSDVGLTWAFADLQTTICLSSIYRNNPLLFPQSLVLIKVLFLRGADSGPSLLELCRGLFGCSFSSLFHPPPPTEFLPTVPAVPGDSLGLQTKNEASWKLLLGLAVSLWRAAYSHGKSLGFQGHPMAHPFGQKLS